MKLQEILHFLQNLSNRHHLYSYNRLYYHMIRGAIYIGQGGKICVQTQLHTRDQIKGSAN
jgi:hypothetical protein